MTFEDLLNDALARGDERKPRSGSPTIGSLVRADVAAHPDAPWTATLHRVLSSTGSVDQMLLDHDDFEKLAEAARKVHGAWGRAKRTGKEIEG